MLDEEDLLDVGTHPGHHLQLPGLVEEVGLGRRELLQVINRVNHLLEVVNPSEGVAEVVRPHKVPQPWQAHDHPRLSLLRDLRPCHVQLLQLLAQGDHLHCPLPHLLISWQNCKMFQYTEEKPTPRLSSMSRSFRTWPHASTKALRMSRVQSFFKVKAARLVKEEREVASWIAEGPFIGTQPPCVIIISLKTAICYSWTSNTRT